MTTVSFRQYMALKHMSTDEYRRAHSPNDVWWLDRMVHTYGYLEKLKHEYRLTALGAHVLQETKDTIDGK